MSSRIDKKYNNRGSQNDIPKNKRKKKKRRPKSPVPFADTPDALKLIANINKFIKISDERLVYGFHEVREGLINCNLEYVLHSGAQNKLKKLNTYGCTMVRTSKSNMAKLGLNIVGITWY